METDQVLSREVRNRDVKEFKKLKDELEKDIREYNIFSSRPSLCTDFIGYEVVGTRLVRN